MREVVNFVERSSNEFRKVVGMMKEHPAILNMVEFGLLWYDVSVDEKLLSSFRGDPELSWSFFD